MKVSGDATEDGLVVFGCIGPMILIMAAAGIGWIWNIVKLFQHINDPLTMMEVVRVIAVPFFPIGCIIGWL